MRVLPKRLSPFQIIMLGYLSIIGMGTLLLMLPPATQNGSGALFSDALFTAASAVCVTGLVIRDTALYWSLFGQTVILLLIQIGGMGVMTVVLALKLASGHKINLLQRSTMQEAVAAPQVGGIAQLTGFIIKTVLLLELLGAAVMAPVFARDFGIARGLWYGLFHAVSAFCNAGFDLMGVRAPFSSLTAYAADPVISLSIGMLIISGGIGFLTWDDLKTNRLHLSRYRLQSKVILVVTAVLIILPAVYFYFVEFVGWGMPFAARALCSFFQAVTPRTAGFNSIDLTALSETGQALLIMLMLIGGSPGSAAGGMKTTTIAVLIVTAVAVFRKKEDAECFGRRIAAAAVKQAAVIFMLYLALFLLGGVLISSLEGLPLLTCLFETASAIGTVGLSLGITPELGIVSRLILIILMFFGRVGGLTLIFAVFFVPHTNSARLPQGQITVG